ncbi:MAG: hypothetical protein EPN86_06345 [Nanoarchaeota archaeon]|nr:MAG: hypothetical protein EPN86_06345 [Nanoarchaeota archaeon]
MKLAASVKVSFFVKPEEDEQALLQAFKTLFPFNLDEIELKRTNAEGFSERKIKIYEAMLSKDRHCNAFVKFMMEKLSTEQKRQLLEQIDSRLHDDLHFYFRFDKDSLVKLGQLWLTDGGNCFHIGISVAAFPKKKDVAKKLLTELLTENIK